MSTRCQVILKDAVGNRVWLYRHSDGYPVDVAPTLNKLCAGLANGSIRKDVENAAGWLIAFGISEYAEVMDRPVALKPSPGVSGGYKIGMYEPSVPECHGDIAFLYELDVDAASWKEIRIPDEDA